jgi:hypothetical protein
MMAGFLVVAGEGWGKKDEQTLFRLGCSCPKVTHSRVCDRDGV